MLQSTIQMKTDLPKFVSLTKNKNKNCYESKKVIIKDDKNDHLLMDNIFLGTIITGKTYPLIWEKNNVRSIEFYREVLK